MQLLEGHIQHYAWGSHEVIARMTGRAVPTPEPEAELWLGAHEAAPSRLLGDGAQGHLDGLVAADPQRVLGDLAARFGGRLPFLLKVLAPVQALSIQAHPSVEEAASAPAGTYGDGWAKPEAWYALTDFEVFAGLRPFDDTRALAELLDVKALTGHVAAATEAPEPARALLATLLHLSSDEQAELADAVVEACRPLAPAEPALDAVVRIAEQHPRDIGLVVLLVMRHVVLRPGDYAFVDAGVLHAGVRGVVVEILANSDNVVRAGLTPKHIDVDELLRIADLDRQIEPERGVLDEGWTCFPASTPYFMLRTAPVAADPLPVPADGRPRILFALDAPVEVVGPQATVRVAPGQGCFLEAGDRAHVRAAAPDEAGSASDAARPRVFLAAPGDA
ncbi:mannose-6-phosphate isomerase, class I [Barrientosiimonas humi]|uniref:mannose-6-phosphate isomerase, class I n=1 Tax=Barrientosiimonas humi TaxID=999931 RepID=UPI00370DDCA9